MITILIKDSDTLYRHGMQKFLSELFVEKYRQSTDFLFELNAENIRKADIILMELCQGEALICTPELIFRKKSIIIGLTHDTFDINVKLPNCISDILFLERDTDLTQISQRIIKRWESLQTVICKGYCHACSTCKSITMSHKQLELMANIYSGHSVKKIASLSDLSDKTIFTYKYNVMKKFRLRSDYELVVFLRRLSEKNIEPNVFRSYINAPCKGQ